MNFFNTIYRVGIPSPKHLKAGFDAQFSSLYKLGFFCNRRGYCCEAAVIRDSCNQVVKGRNVLYAAGHSQSAHGAGAFVSPG